MTKVIVFIPARLESTRLPRKMLLAETGKPLIQHTYENACKAGFPTYVLTDSDDIINEWVYYGNSLDKIYKTLPANNGTERIVSFIIKTGIKLFDLTNNDIIINVQGDEPLIEPENIKILAKKIYQAHGIATLCTNWKGQAKVSDVGVAYFENIGYATYFTRRPQQGLEHKHIGIYAYTVAFLNRYLLFEKGPFESNTRLEQFRALENGCIIGCKQVNYYGLNIDTREDYDLFKERIKNEH